MMILKLVSLDKNPILSPQSVGAEGNRFGFEGGTAQKIDGRYYIFTTEVFDEPKTAASRLVIWDSDDGHQFTRRTVLSQTNGDWNDTTHRMSPWSPMSVFDQTTDRWNVFFVGYRRKPGSNQVYNMSGLIGRLESQAAGYGGILGPYTDQGWIDLSRQGDAWEGEAAGLVSFYPYRVGDHYWYAFYGTNTALGFIDPQTKPQYDNSQQILFHCGLARADQLNGHWTRCSDLNPVLMDPEFVENPIVTQISSDLYIVVYDGANKHQISYAFSRDGLHWDSEQLLELTDAPTWLDAVRTPLGLIAEAGNRFTLYFTAFDGVNPEGVEPLWHDGFGYVGRCQVMLEPSPSAS